MNATPYWMVNSYWCSYKILGTTPTPLWEPHILQSYSLLHTIDTKTTLCSQSSQVLTTFNAKLSVCHITSMLHMRSAFKKDSYKLSHTHLDAGTVCFFCRSTRNLSPTWRYTSTNVLKAVSRTADMGSPNSFTTDGTSRDNDRDCAPCLKQVI